MIEGDRLWRRHGARELRDAAAHLEDLACAIAKGELPKAPELRLAAWQKRLGPMLDVARIRSTVSEVTSTPGVGNLGIQEEELAASWFSAHSVPFRRSILSRDLARVRRALPRCANSVAGAWSAAHGPHETIAAGNKANAALQMAIDELRLVVAPHVGEPVPHLMVGHTYTANWQRFCDEYDAQCQAEARRANDHVATSRARVEAWRPWPPLSGSMGMMLS